jgi:carbohydrate diacid regulator
MPVECKKTVPQRFTGIARKSMFDAEIAGKFIENLTAYTEYNINIMDKNGIIIASRNPERVGTFHEIAYDIITKNKSIVEVSSEDSYLGVKPGVNLLLTHNGKGIGVIGVTGDPVYVKPIAMIIKMAMESMLEYEHEKDILYKRKSLKEQFIHELIYNTDSDPTELRVFAKQLNYKEKYMRIPILIQSDKGKEAEIILQSIKDNPKHTAQDLSFITRNKQVVIFKTLPDSADIFSNYKYLIGEYLNSFLQMAMQSEDTYHFYIGTIQNQFSYYRDAFLHCTWLQRRVSSDAIGLFFYDYVDEYMNDLIPDIELHKIFNCFRKNFDKKYTDSYIKLMGALKKNNYNMVTSSKELYIHKNTLAFQLNKIRDKLDRNPHQSERDRRFMEYLYYYLRKISS